ncbi:MAG: CdaR family protein [Candidatus Dormibacteria bacterium]
MTPPAFLTRNLRLKVVAALLATVVWAGVVYASNPPDTRSVAVKVPQDTGAVAPFVLVHTIPDIVIQVSGTREHLNAFDPSDIVVGVNYRAIKQVGTQQIPISVVNNDRDVILDNPPSSVTATVDRLGSRDVPVTVVVNTPPPQGYVVTNTSTTPSTVTLVGPQQQLAGLQARVSVDLGNQKTDYSADQKVSVYDPSGVQLGSFAILVGGQPQTTVQVAITVTAVITSRASAVVPPYSGTPAAGHEVVGISVTPATVVLTGPQDLLNTLDSVPTQVINLAGIDGNRTYVVRVTPPSGVSVTPDTVTVTVTVISIAIAGPPSPSPSPTPTPAPSSSAGGSTSSPRPT